VKGAEPGWMERGVVRASAGLEASMKWVQAPIDRCGPGPSVGPRETLYYQELVPTASTNLLAPTASTNIASTNCWHQQWSL